MSKKRVVNLNHPPKDVQQEEIEEALGDFTEEENQQFEQSVEKARQKVKDGKGAKPTVVGAGGSK